MSVMKHLFLITIGAVVITAQEKDTEITRVQPLREEDRGRAVSQENLKSVYLINLLTLPRTNGGSEVTDKNLGSNDLNEATYPKDPRGRNPALFLLQKVNDDGKLPDGIYYRPAKDDDAPPSVIQKDITDVQAFILGRQYG